MTLPVILWRESCGYGSLAWNQVYLQLTRSSNGLYGGIQPSVVTLQRWGRGVGGDMRYAMTQTLMAIRATTLGFAGAVDTSVSKVGLALAYQQGGHVGSSVIAEFWDDDGHGNGSFDAALLHFSIETLPDGRLCAKNGQSGTIIGSPSTFVVPVGVAGPSGNFTHFEIVPVTGHPLIHATNGAVQVYANGALVLDLQGVTTRSTQAAGSGKLGYVQVCATPVAVVGDILIHDCSGAGRLGDLCVGAFKALAAGTYTAGTAVGDATLLACVNEQAADGDTKYIKFDDTSLPKAASFTTDPLPATAISVVEVSPLTILRKSDAGTNTHRTLFKSGATLLDGGVDVATPAGYNLSTGVGPAPGHQTDPATSAAWLKPACDAVEIGERRIA